MREKLHMDELILKIRQSKATVPVLVILGMLLFLSLLLSIGLRTNKRDIVNTSEVQRQEMLTEMNQVKDYLTTLDTSVERYLAEEMTSISNLVENSSVDMDSSFQQGITNLKSEMKTLQTSIETTQNELNNLYTTVESNDGENSQVMNQEFTVVKNSIASLNEDFKDAHENVETLIKALNEDLDSYYEENKKDLEKYFADQKADLEAYFGEDKQESVSQNQLLEDKFLEQSSNVESLNQKLEESLSSQEQLIEENFQQQTLHIDEVYVELQGILETMSTDMETLLKEQFTQMMDTLTEMEDTYLATMEDYHNKTIWNLNAMNESMTNQHEELTTVISNQYQNMTTTINNNNSVQEESFDNLMLYLDQKLSQVFTFVSDGKKKIVSALLTKGVDINEDATFAELYDAVMSIEQELLVGVEKVPGDVTYQYHYHTDVNGNEIHAATCPLEQMGGCYIVPVYHYHEDANGTAQAASYQAPDKGGCFVSNVYHVHVGASTGNGGCYTTPVYHTHTGNASAVGGCYGNVPYTVYKYCGCTSYAYTQINGHSTCANCYHNHGGDKCDAVRSSSVAYKIGLTCGKSTSTIDRYALSCGMTPETIIGYSLGCGMTTSTIVAYQPGCGLSDGQIIGAIIVYDESAVMPTAAMYQVRPIVEVPVSSEENIVEADTEVTTEEIPEEGVENSEGIMPEDTTIPEEIVTPGEVPEEPEHSEGEEELPTEDEIQEEVIEPSLPEELPSLEEPDVSDANLESEVVTKEEVVEEIEESNTEGGDG